jgi:hypothetical protein
MSKTALTIARTTINETDALAKNAQPAAMPSRPARKVRRNITHATPKAKARKKMAVLMLEPL